MNNTIKKALLTTFSAALALSMAGLVACNKDDPGNTDNTDKTAYTVTVEAAEHGKITASETSATAGTKITLTVAPENGYELVSLLIDSEPVTVTESTTYSFEMPAKNVTVEGTFAEAGKGVTVSATEHGKVTADKPNANAGETVTLNITPDFGYKLAEVKVNGTALTATDGKYSFTKSNGKDVVTATFEKDPEAFVTEALPAKDAFSISASAAVGGGTAKSHWDFAYGETSLNVTVYVEDAVVMAGDNVEIYFGTAGNHNKTLGANNVGVKVAPVGETIYYSVPNGVYVAGTVSGVSSTCKVWSKAEGENTGYKVNVSVDYSALGFADKAAAMGNVTMLAALSNKSNSFAASKAYIYPGATITNPDTYAQLVADSEWEENYYANGAGMLGSSENITMQGGWDLSHDYGKEDENYDERYVSISRFEKDNDLVFFRTKTNEFYARATFELSGVYNNEAYGKVGFMVYDGASQSGLFYYLDAAGKTLNDITGSSLGYNAAEGKWGSWCGIPNSNGSYNKTTHQFTLAIGVRDNVASLYFVNSEGQDVLAYQTCFVPTSSKLDIGFKTFNLGVKLTDYSVTEDTENDEFIAHNPELVQKDLDVLFAGDSYMDFFKNAYNCQSTLVEEIGMDNLENVGVGGTQVDFWNNAAKTTTLKRMYSFDKIVFHIGVNDIDSAKSVDTVFNSLKAMFNRYHDEFPDTDIYWISLVPNKFFIKNNNTETYNNEYKQLNAEVKKYIDGVTYLHYIDVETAFTAKDGGARANLFMYDGLHLNPVNGYPLWSYIIKTELGYTVKDGEKFGYNSNVNLASTGGWNFDNTSNLAYIPQSFTAPGGETVEQVLFLKEADYAKDVKFEATLTAPSRFYEDNYSKVGVALRNDSVTVFAYFETANDANHGDGEKTQYASLVYRDNVSNRNGEIGVNNWNWNAQSGYATGTVKNIKTTPCTIGIAKVGSTFVLLVDGKAIASLANVPGITADSEMVPAIITFARRVTLSSYSYSANKAEFGADVIAYSQIDGVLNAGEGWTAEVLAKRATYNLDGAQVNLLGLNTEYGVRIGGIVYTNKPASEKLQQLEEKDAWHHFLNMEIRLNGFTDAGVNIQAGTWHNAKNLCNVNYTTGANAEGNGYTYKTTFEILVPHNVAHTTPDMSVPICLGGVYTNGFVWLDRTGDNQMLYTNYITADGLVAAPAVLDGDFSDDAWTTDIKAKTFTETVNGAEVSVMGFKAKGGVMLGFTVVHFKNVNAICQGDGTLWWNYMGPEMRLFGLTGKQICASAHNNYSQFSTFGWKTVFDDTTQKYTTTYEIYVPFSVYGYDPTTVIGDVPAYFCGVYETGWARMFGAKEDYDITHYITDNGMYAASNKEEYNRNLPETVTLDGELNEATVWTAEVKANAITDGEATVMGKKVEGGVLLAFTFNHDNDTMNKCQAEGTAWFHFMGPEIRLGTTEWQICASVWNNYTQYCAFGYKTVNGTSKAHTTTFEMYVPYTAINGVDVNGDVPVAMAAVYENGFKWLFTTDWRVNYVITDDGIKALPVLDGNLNDACWTDTVKANAATYKLNDTASATVVATKAAGGVMLGVTVNSAKNIDAILGTEDRWEHQQHVGWALFGIQHDVGWACPAPNRGITMGSFGHNTVDNGEEAEYRYSTTYEIYIPYACYRGCDASGRIGLVMCVQADKMGDVFMFQNGGTNWFGVHHYITDNGLVKA